MNIKTLATVSAIALLGLTPAAYAQEAANEQQSQTEGAAAGQQDESLWESFEQETSEAAEDAYEEVQSVTVDNDSSETSTITINQRKTATGIIGSPVMNEAGEEVAEVSDIIIDRDGNAVLVVISDAEFMGMGGEAAFDYNTIIRQNEEGDVIMPLSEEMISNAAEFSYDREEAGESVRVIPTNGYSVAELLDGDLLDEQSESVAQVDNLTFESGRAEQLIVGFNKILGMGGETAALKFDNVEIVENEEGVDFQLSANQAAQFENYKQTVVN